jgi:hypothetical protein
MDADAHIADITARIASGAISAENCESQGVSVQEYYDLLATLTPA